jgi:hypothetical protein
VCEILQIIYAKLLDPDNVKNNTVDETIVKVDEKIKVGLL